MAQAHHETPIPRIFGVIERTRLLEKLKLAAEHKLTLICAPPGYGKTTTAAQFAQQTPHTVVWHTVEERERDFPTFYAQCLTSLSEVVPAAQSLANTPHYEPGELASDLANLLRVNLRQELFFILDDVHNLIGASLTEAWLQTFVSLAPAKCHIILVTRALPPLSLTEMIARREVLAVGQDELRFTGEEIEQLASEVRGITLSSKSVQELVQRLEGWPAGIILALQPLPADLERLLLSGGEGPEALFDSLASLTLDAQPPGLRDFLLASSTLGRLTPELATNVLGLVNSADWIAEALNRNLFLSRIHSGLSYHRLFRSFLQRQLQERNYQYYVALHLKAAQWFADHDDIDEAFEHYILAGAPESASIIIDQLLSSYYAQGKIETLLKWADDLAKTEVHNPKLLYFVATVHLDRLNYEAALGELDRSEVMFVERNDQIFVAEVQLQRARLNLQNGSYLVAIAQAEKLTSLPFDDANIRGRALRVIGFAHLRLGRPDLAAEYLEEALPLSRASGDKLALSNVLQDLEVVYLRLGQLEDAGACLQEVVALRRALGSKSLLALSLNNLGYHYHQHGDYAQALSTFQEGLSVISRVRNKLVESYLLWSMGDLQRDRGSFDEAWQLYSRALEFTGNREPSLRCSILISAATLRRWQQKAQESLTLAEEAFALADAHSLAIENLLAQACFWAVRGQQGEAGMALESLSVLIEDLKKRQTITEVAQVSVICAHVALLRYDKVTADFYLKSALHMMQQGGSLQPLIAEITYSAPLEKFISANPAKYALLVQGMTRLRNSQSKSLNVIRLEDRVPGENVYSLRAQTLGKEKLERDGVPVLPGEWRATAARELFFYLLFQGPQLRETISLDFWPDSSPSRVRSNFHTTLYRVRQALGENVIVFRDEQYMINPDLDIWCDAHDFKTLVQRAQNLSFRDARTEDLYRRAVDLYQGDFLPLLEADWIVAYREDLKEIYLDSVVGLGRCSEARRDFKQALNMFRQALKVDPFREDVHRYVMTCYAQQGQRQKVYAHLKELEKLLQDELGAAPTRETLAHVKSLLN